MIIDSFNHHDWVRSLSNFLITERTWRIEARWIINQGVTRIFHIRLYNTLHSRQMNSWADYLHLMATIWRFVYYVIFKVLAKCVVNSLLIWDLWIFTTHLPSKDGGTPNFSQVLKSGLNGDQWIQCFEWLFSWIYPIWRVSGSFKTC